MPFPDITARLGSIRDYCSVVEQSSKTLFSKLKEFRNNPEFFQKVCQVAFASIELAIIRSPEAASLSRLASVLKTANMHDFYLFLKFPRQFFFPVTPEVIKENKVLDSMERILEEKYDAFQDDLNATIAAREGVVELSPVQKLLLQKVIEISEDDEDIRLDIEESVTFPINMRFIAFLCLERQLIKGSEVYRNVEQFKNRLQYRLSNNLLEIPAPGKPFKNAILFYLVNVFIEKYGIDPTEDDIQELRAFAEYISAISLDNLDVPLRHVPLLERITNVTWNVVDVGCIGLYFRDWGFIDTAQWSESIGQFKVFHWVKDQNLGNWVVGLVGTAYAIKILEAFRKLLDDKLTPQERTRARWDIAAAGAELIFYSVLYLNGIGKTAFNLASIQCLAIFAKGFGLVAIAVRPKHEFFQLPVATAAA